MLMGMGFVFVFLGTLIALVSLMSRWVESRPDTATGAPPEAESGVAEKPLTDPELISVITSAIQSYREQQKSNNV